MVLRKLPWVRHVLGLQEVVRLARREEAVLDQAHQHAAGEVLVALHHVDVLGLHLSHVVKLRRHGGEARRRVEGSIVPARGVAVLGALGDAEDDFDVGLVEASAGAGTSLR